MFGGLQIKGATASKVTDDDVDGTSELSVPAPTGTSAFGFMNAGDPSNVPEAPASELSSFSFLNSSAPDSTSETPPTATDVVPATMTSGFSFMMQDTTTTACDPTSEKSTTSADNAVSATSSSGFDFMNAAGTPAISNAVTAAVVVEETNAKPIVEEAPAALPATVSSGFSFLSENPPKRSLDVSSSAVQPETPSVTHTRTNSVSSASSVPTVSSFTPAPNTVPAKNGNLIAGAGVTFGTSSAKPRIKKKKTRAAKIGMGSNNPDTSKASTPPSPPPPVAPTSALAPNETKSARDHALEATYRAEAFMQAKVIEETRSSTQSVKEPTSVAASKTGLATDQGIDTQDSTDEVLMAAKVAAEKAKIMQHQQKGKGGGFMGTFFKGFRAGSNTAGASSGPTANYSKDSSSTHSLGSNTSGNTMDQLNRKQQQIPDPAISLNDEENTDDEVVVTTSVGSYEHAAPKQIECASVTANADVITETNDSEVITFLPPTIMPAATQNFSVSYGEGQPSVEMPAEPKESIDNLSKQIFENHQKYFSDSVNRAMEKVEDARNLKKGLLEERFVALAKERFASREIEQIEELQQAAIDEEDYEQADELGQKLDGHKREKSEVANMLVNNTIALEKLESENVSLGELVVSCFEDLTLRLNDLKQKEILAGKKDDNEILTQYESISKQLSAEHERLQQDLKHLERDEQLVSEERKELEDSIKDQTGEIETQKEEANSNLTEVENEIEGLRKALQEKQKSAADLRTKIYGFEDSISKVRVKFSRQLTRVDKKEVSLKESRREWEIENEQHKRQREAHDLQVQTHSNTILAHEEMMKTLECELELSNVFREVIPTQLGIIEEKSESEDRDSDDEGSLAQLKADVVKCEGAIDAVKKTLKIASTAIQDLQSERDTLIAKIPILETQKKAAASERNFKAAGKFSKEIKDANTRINECEEELDGDAKAKKASAEEKLRRLDLELLEAKKVADAKEKIAAEKRMKTLKKKIAQLIEVKEEKCGKSSLEGTSVKSVAARVLEGQIVNLQAEGYDLGIKYGGWDLDEGESTNISTESDDNHASLNNSVEQDDISQKGEGALRSEDRLLKAKQLLTKCSEIEEKIQDAAEREDFEVAADLQKILDNINVEIEELKITDEECELLAVREAHPTERQGELYLLSNEERISKIEDLLIKSSELEQKVEEAVEKEDFEAADVLQTKLDQITAELTKLNVTDEEKESLTKGSAAFGESSNEKAEDFIADSEEEKKEGEKEKPSNLDHEEVDNGE